MSERQGWHESILPPRWREATDAIERSQLARDFYLAGGTGAALQLGHRTSIDLDLFRTQSFSPQAVRDRPAAHPGICGPACGGRFVDLYFILQKMEVRELLDLFDRKFQSAAPNRVHLAKALTYFVDAEAEPMPHMLVSVDWERIKSFFEHEAPKEF